jgi:hypothetical protein
VLHDATRPGRQEAKPLPAATVERVVAITLTGLPDEATHWTGREMGKIAGISLRSAQRIWAAHGLRPHRVRRFKLSNDPKFAAKVQDIVGLYVNPPSTRWWWCRSMRRAKSGSIRNFVRELGMIGAKEPNDAAPQRTSYPRRCP